VEEGGIKTTTSLIYCRITLRNVCGQLYTFTFMLVRIKCFMLGGICFMSFSLFIFSSWYRRNYDVSAIFCLLHYSFLSVMKKNVWHSNEQCTIDESIDQWHSRFKTCICAEGRHFKHTEINLCTVEQQRNNIPCEHFLSINVFHHFELN